MQLPYWRIKNIEIRGLEALGDEDIKLKVYQALDGKYLFFLSRDSILTLRTNFLTEKLKKEFPKIEKITITKSFPDTLKIDLAERKLFGIFCSVSNCAYIDNTGFAYESSPSSSGSLILKIVSDQEETKVGVQSLEPALMEQVIFLGKETEKVAGAKVIAYELSLRFPREIHITTSEGFKIYFNRADDFTNVFKVLRTVLNEEIKDRRANLDYIDLRFGNKVFYKWQGGTK
mgnify:FL=1